MNRKILFAAVLLGSAGLLPIATLSSAYAQSGDKEKALDAYRKGTTEYNLGRWKSAIALFEKAYSLYPDAAFLFNIAQSYRQADDCKQAAFFYKRYLSINTSAPNKKEVEGYIRDLDETCRLRGQSNLSPPDTTQDPKKPDPNATNNSSAKTPDSNNVVSVDPKSEKPDTQVAVVTGNGGNGGDVTKKIGDPEEPNDDTGPSLLVAYAYAGATLMLLDGDGVDEVVRFNGTVTMGYPLQIGSIHLDAGIALSVASYDWIKEIGGEDVDGSVGFTTLLANVGARVEVFENFMLRGELGLGPMFVSGLDDEENPFLDDLAFDSAVTVFAARFAIGAEYAFTDSLAVSVEPIVLQVAGAPEALVVDEFNSLQSLIGVRYSM